MPGKDEQNQFDKEFNEAQRRAAEKARRKKYNPDGTLRNTGANEN
mgnify:CR=1 FL=1